MMCCSARQRLTHIERPPLFQVQNSSSFVFTLIQKFRGKGKGLDYKKVTDNENIIVLVDEAHRGSFSSG